ncbi:u3 small nucleolar RNA-associated protein 11 [Athelia psychrophila]|uniref:U3 small nucleolar RNA-associated protein 11 n=1 Tax=Athelia psychrophila TaxID=1759441 RepID=A0A166NVG4_9AGAM|nr:u3 small nucleolar RNA-associated protein 11 [Fibularhizoctonia sp. CBS 109695]
MTSSLRNSLHRRNHKERSQLANRSRFGLLEKHKDYVLRARDYHSKQDRLTRLKQKATERNKDEFYFGMNKEKTQGGVHIKERGNAALPVDIVKVLKTQDENYIRTMRTAGLKKIDKLKAQLTAIADLIHPSLLDQTAAGELDEEELEILRAAGIVSSARSKGKGKPRHIVFVEDDAAARQYVSSQRPSSSNVDSDMDVTEEPQDLGWTVVEGKKKKPKAGGASSSTGNNREAAAEQSQLAAQNRTRLLKELSARLTRDTHLRYAEREFEMQRALMGKGSRQKLVGVERVEGDETRHDQDEEDSRHKRKDKRGVIKEVDVKTWKPRVYKWKLERKR